MPFPFRRWGLYLRGRIACRGSRKLPKRSRRYSKDLSRVLFQLPLIFSPTLLHRRSLKVTPRCLYLRYPARRTFPTGIHPTVAEFEPPGQGSPGGGWVRNPGVQCNPTALRPGTTGHPWGGCPVVHGFGAAGASKSAASPSTERALPPVGRATLAQINAASMSRYPNLDLLP